MAIVILVAVLGWLGLLGIGAWAAVTAAGRLRREREELEGAFAKARGNEYDPEEATPTWSSFDLASLRDDPGAIDERDPFATLIPANLPVSWHTRSLPNGSEPNPIVWRAPAQAPTIMFAVGLGLLVAGAAAVTTAARLQREWEQVDDAFAQTRGNTLDAEGKVGPSSSFDFAVVREVVEAVVQRDPSATPTRASSTVSWHDSSNGNGSGHKPIAEPKPIEWRAPTEPAAR